MKPARCIIFKSICILIKSSLAQFPFIQLSMCEASNGSYVTRQHHHHRCRHKAKIMYVNRELCDANRKVQSGQRVEEEDAIATWKFFFSHSNDCMQIG